MYFLDFLSQYNRFLEGKLSAPDFAYWLFANDDEMEEALTADEWDAYVKAQHLAAEWTGEFISESHFRDRLRNIWNNEFRIASQSFSVFSAGNVALTRRSLLPLPVNSIVDGASPLPTGKSSSPHAGQISGDSYPARLQHRVLLTP